jgi:serine/threonine protein phosphatase PrpC
MLVLADGMGGHLHGEVAAQITVQFVTEAFEREAKTKLADPFLFLIRSITNAHHSILDYAATRKLEDTPRTTCVACIVQDSVAYWAHVGDSRLYLIRNGHVHVQTKDHSRVQMLVDAGRIREEAVAVHPERNKIYNCLGSSTPPQVDISRKTVLQEGDSLLLCSDGLWGPLNSRIIGGALLGGNIMKAVPDLMMQAESRAGKDSDNISAVAITWLESYPEAGLPGDVSTQTLELGQFTTQIEDFGRTEPEVGRGGDLSDEEIERAIEEIRLALRKNTTKPPQ